MQLGWLQTFIAVYHTGSFTKAAQKLGITQPAVTQHIRGLESKFGKPLFDRTPQGAVPTSEGTALAYEVQAPMANLNAAICRHFDTSPSSRPVRLGGPAELVTARLMASISELIASGLDIRISFREAPDLLEDLRTGHMDMVVSTVQPRMRGVDSVALIDEELALLASPQVAETIPSGALAVDGPRALEKLPIIAYGETFPIIDHYWRSVFDAPPPRVPSAVVPDLRAVIAAVCSSAGISVIPTYLCADEMAAGLLVPLWEPDIPPLNTYHLATRHGALADLRLARLHDHPVAAARNWELNPEPPAPGRMSNRT